mgnify:CR=1 FL=1
MRARRRDESRRNWSLSALFFRRPAIGLTGDPSRRSSSVAETWLHANTNVDAGATLAVPDLRRVADECTDGPRGLDGRGGAGIGLGRAAIRRAVEPLKVTTGSTELPRPAPSRPGLGGARSQVRDSPACTAASGWTEGITRRAPAIRRSWSRPSFGCKATPSAPVRVRSVAQDCIVVHRCRMVQFSAFTIIRCVQ